MRNALLLFGLLLAWGATATPAPTHGTTGIIECAVASAGTVVELRCPGGLVLDIPATYFPYQPAYRGQGIVLERKGGRLTYADEQPRSCHDRIDGTYQRLPVHACFVVVP